jgi:hypothetical protein
MKHFLHWTLLAVVAVALAAGCGSEGGTVAEGICAASTTQACDCPGSEDDGVQTCADDGKTWGTCEGCPAAPDVIEPEDIQEQPEDIQEQPEDIQEPKDVKVPLVCLLNNCTEDAHCTGCSDGRQTCLVEENRCVACNPTDGSGCGEGEGCSSFGICVEDQLTCPTDAQGVPTNPCVKNADCSACSPKYQVCDTQSNECVSCTATNTSHCLASDTCINGECSPKCPQTCNIDNDCLVCGPPDAPAHACNNHKCAQCSPTWPCPAGEVCLPMGVCYPPCGLPGGASGSCLSDKDCNFCGDPKTPGTFICNKPVNDPDGHGTCLPAAEGCADLGTGVAVLPLPWSDYTQLCSEDSNCANINIDLNVGKLIRDLTGTEEVMGIAIGDANVQYGMHECAEIKLTANIDCGVCVPCDEDADCMPIPIDPLMMDLFSQDPLAAIAGAILIDMLYGENPDHNLNFYCQPIGVGYGVCAPCGNPMQPCGQVDPGPGDGNCDHDVCTEGAALDPTCGSCSKAVCTNDNYCCAEAWDEICVGLVDTFCATSCGGDPGCADDICTNDQLPAQNAACGECVEAVCAGDSFCCNKESGAWDGYCVAHTEDTAECMDLCGGNPGCPHSECEAGGPLTIDCSACAAAVCAADNWCCSNEWDGMCVDAAMDDPNCNCS